MPWIEALLRGQRVLARVHPDRSFVSEGGRVEIRYRPSDTRAYRAAQRNLTVAEGAKVLPDEACPEAEFAPPRSEAADGVGGAGAPGRAPTAAAPRAVVARGGAGSGARGGGKTASVPKAAAIQAGQSWVAYTDGACSGNPGPAGSGMVVVMPDGVMREGYEYLGTATNNVAELTAILRALEAIPREASHVVVHTDSQYAIGVLTKGWRPKVNQELIASIKETLAAHTNVALVYVPGHSGVPLNERADELARTAIRDGRTAPLRV